MKHEVNVVTIGEFDPSGQTGVALDRAVLSGFGIDSIMLVSSLKLGNGKPMAIPPDTLDEQLRKLVRPQASPNIKIGQLVKRGNIEIASSFFEDQDLAGVNVVLDVSVDAGENQPLLTSGAISLLRMRLLPLATVVIAYLSEAARLAGNEVTNISQMKQAAEAIHIFGPRVVLVRADQPVDDEWVDIYFDGAEHQFLFIKGARPADIRAGREIFATAVVAYMAQGRTALESIGLAQKYESRHSAAQDKPA